MCFLIGSSAEISSGRSKSAPYFFGTKMFEFMPRPQPHVPNRIGIGLPSASAVPLVLSMQFNNGSATFTAAPPTIPRSTVRLVNLLMRDTPGGQSILVLADQGRGRLYGTRGRSGVDG